MLQFTALIYICPATGNSFKICSILPTDAVEMLTHLTAFIGPHEHFTYF